MLSCCRISDPAEDLAAHDAIARLQGHRTGDHVGVETIRPSRRRKKTALPSACSGSRPCGSAPGTLLGTPSMARTTEPRRHRLGAARRQRPAMGRRRRGAHQLGGIRREHPRVADGWALKMPAVHRLEGTDVPAGEATAVSRDQRLPAQRRAQHRRRAANHTRAGPDFDQARRRSVARVQIREWQDVQRAERAGGPACACGTCRGAAALLRRGPTIERHAEVRQRARGRGRHQRRRPQVPLRQILQRLEPVRMRRRGEQAEGQEGDGSSHRKAWHRGTWPGRPNPPRARMKIVSPVRVRVSPSACLARHVGVRDDRYGTDPLPAPPPTAGMSADRGLDFPRGGRDTVRTGR